MKLSAYSDILELSIYKYFSKSYITFFVYLNYILSCAYFQFIWWIATFT